MAMGRRTTMRRIADYAEAAMEDFELSPYGKPIGVDDFKLAMRHLASGVSIVTSGHGSGRRGLTVNSACALSAAPSTIVVGLNRSTEAHDAIISNRAFAVNFLAFEQLDIALRFAGHNGWRGEARFGLGAWTQLATQSPILVNCLCSVDCQLVEQVEQATHSVLIGRIVESVRRVDGDPLIFFKGQFTSINNVDLLSDYIENGFGA